MNKYKEEIRTCLIKEIVDKAKQELNVDGKGYNQWVYGISVNSIDLIKKFEDLDEECLFETKILVKMDGTDLVDGTFVGYEIKKMNGFPMVEIMLDFAEEEPIFQGGTIQDGIKWLTQNSSFGGNEIIYLDMRSPTYSSYKLRA